MPTEVYVECQCLVQYETWTESGPEPTLGGMTHSLYCNAVSGAERDKRIIKP